MVANVGIIDYGVGNLQSVVSALKAVDTSAELVTESGTLCQYDRLLLPGVGSYRAAKEQLIAKNFVEPLNQIIEVGSSVVLGICVGMQLLSDMGTEHGVTQGLGYVPGNVDRFDKEHLSKTNLKIPHVGFSQIDIYQKSPLFEGFGENIDFYFTHSYRMICDSNANVLATCTHGEKFAAVVQSGNVYGMQFHPEKSQANGLLILKNFVQKVRCQRNV